MESDLFRVGALLNSPVTQTKRLQMSRRPSRLDVTERRKNWKICGNERAYGATVALPTTYLGLPPTGVTTSVANYVPCLRPLRAINEYAGPMRCSSTF